MKICVTCGKNNRKVHFVENQCAYCYSRSPIEYPKIVVFNKKEVKRKKQYSPVDKEAKKKAAKYKKEVQKLKESKKEGRIKLSVEQLIPEFKICILCSENKPITSYYFMYERHYKMKLPDSYCKECRKIKNIEYRTNNPNKYKAYHKEYNNTYIRKKI